MVINIFYINQATMRTKLAGMQKIKTFQTGDGDQLIK